MEQPTGNVVAFPSSTSQDVLTQVLHDGARKMLVKAIDEEVTVYVESRGALVDGAGHRLVVRNGHLPERNLQTPLGDIPIQQPRVRDKRPDGEREVFHSSILPPYLRKTKSLEDLLPWLYLKGVSTGGLCGSVSGAAGA